MISLVILVNALTVISWVTPHTPPVRSIETELKQGATTLTFPALVF